MNKHLQHILDLVDRVAQLTAQEKEPIIKAVKKADNDLTIAEFKLERTGKVKQTVSVLLEETIAELEQKHRELEKEAALERVRGKIASMRTPEDLQRITPLVWKELMTLKVPFFRCGVLIVDEHRQSVQAFLSTPTGESLAAMDLPFDSSEMISGAVRSWQAKEVFTLKWDREQFLEWGQSMVREGLLEDQQQYQGNREAPESLALHFVPFAQGMLYVGHEELLEEEHLNWVKALADTFSVAYARYEDFVQLEKAKINLEATLSDLKAAQNQLIQAEKMASLGELTAGIAHEIQNPLNFVNNFSEVSIELLDEMKEELDAGDPEEAKEIAASVIENLKKIIHHGKRADAIVKGMLQHSRSDNGVREPTDINALCEEYLRLAYHGVRAKDKTFQVALTTEFGENIGKITLIPQEIGRVVLNLITNAFYAVAERKKREERDYVPAVSLQTCKNGRQVIIKVADNGSGISPAVLDKIYQPFFTTKPAGQGTGLGLSLSYDIIKAHNGELIVESEEGKGTEFRILLTLENS